MKQTCVIGGSGFIGVHLVEALLAQARQVTVVGRTPTPVRKLPHDVKYVCGDYGEKHFLTHLLKDTDEIVDLAYSTVPGTSFESPVEDILTNLPSAVRLLDVVSNSPVRKMVIVSSGGTVYGQAHAIPISEDHVTNPISPYGVTKLAIEKYALLYKELKGLPVVGVRPSNAFGAHQRPFSGQGLIATAIASILEDKEIMLYGDPGTVRDYVYVSDVAAAIIAALNAGIPGACYNVGTGMGRNNKDVLATLSPFAESAGFKIRTKTLPSRRFDVAVNVLDAKKINRDTGWKPMVSFEEGIERTWNWFLMNARH